MPPWRDSSDYTDTGSFLTLGAKPLNSRSFVHCREPGEVRLDGADGDELADERLGRSRCGNREVDRLQGSAVPGQLRGVFVAAALDQDLEFSSDLRRVDLDRDAVLERDQ